MLCELNELQTELDVLIHKTSGENYYTINRYRQNVINQVIAIAELQEVIKLPQNHRVNMKYSQ